MTKEELIKLADASDNAENEVYMAIERLTKDKPFIVFDPEKVDTEEGLSRDEIFELPYGYNVGKHGYYDEGRVQSVQGIDVKVYMLGEDNDGEIFEMELHQIPESSRTEILRLIASRME